MGQYHQLNQAQFNSLALSCLILNYRRTRGRLLQHVHVLLLLFFFVTLFFAYVSTPSFTNRPYSSALSFSSLISFSHLHHHRTRPKVPFHSSLLSIDPDLVFLSSSNPLPGLDQWKPTSAPIASKHTRIFFLSKEWQNPLKFLAHYKSFLSPKSVCSLTCVKTRSLCFSFFPMGDKLHLSS